MTEDFIAHRHTVVHFHFHKAVLVTIGNTILYQWLQPYNVILTLCDTYVQTPSILTDTRVVVGWSVVLKRVGETYTLVSLFYERFNDQQRHGDIVVRQSYFCFWQFLQAA